MKLFYFLLNNIVDFIVVVLLAFGSFELYLWYKSRMKKRKEEDEEE